MDGGPSTSSSAAAAATTTTTTDVYCFCFDDEDVENRELATLGCGHTMHRVCLRRLLRHKWSNTSSPKTVDTRYRLVTTAMQCPLCRETVCPDDLRQLQAERKKIFIHCNVPVAASCPCSSFSSTDAWHANIHVVLRETNRDASSTTTSRSRTSSAEVEVARQTFDARLLQDCRDGSTSGGRPEKVLTAEFEVLASSPLSTFKATVSGSQCHLQPGGHGHADPPEGERRQPPANDRPLHRFRFLSAHLPSAEPDADEQEKIRRTVEQLERSGSLVVVTEEEHLERFRQTLRRQRRQLLRHQNQQQQQRRQQLRRRQQPVGPPRPEPQVVETLSSDDDRSSSPPLPSPQELFSILPRLLRRIDSETPVGEDERRGETSSDDQRFLRADRDHNLPGDAYRTGTTSAFQQPAPRPEETHGPRSAPTAAGRCYDHATASTVHADSPLQPQQQQQQQNHQHHHQHQQPQQHHHQQQQDATAVASSSSSIYKYSPASPDVPPRTTTTTTTTTGRTLSVDRPDRSVRRATLVLKRREFKLRNSIKSSIRTVLNETSALSNAILEWDELKRDLHELRDGDNCDGTSQQHLAYQRMQVEDRKTCEVLIALRRSLNEYRAKIPTRFDE